MRQNNSSPKSWYKKKRYIIPLSVLGLILIFVPGDNSSTQIKSESATIPSYSSKTTLYQPTNDAADTISGPSLKPDTTSTSNNSFSNDNYYTNVSGNTVHSPTYTNDSSVPPGASARCRDGTFSFSQHRSGTCSHHGGVAEWL